MIIPILSGVDPPYYTYSVGFVDVNKWLREWTYSVGAILSGVDYTLICCGVLSEFIILGMSVSGP